ncbi:MAG: hypothetical protein ACM3ZA_10145 [Bacillota bacterium]
MTGNLILLGLLALVSGTLFRAYATTGLHILRMFSTMGIALAGIVAAMTLTQAQAEAARAEARRQLKSLGPDFRLVPAPGGYVAVGPHAITYCRFDAMPNYGRQAAVRRRLERSETAALAVACSLQARLAAAGDGDVPVQAALVLLRRRADTARALSRRGTEVLHLNPDNLRPALDAAGRPELLDAQRRRHLAQLLSERDDARQPSSTAAVRVTH